MTPWVRRYLYFQGGLFIGGAVYGFVQGWRRTRNKPTEFDIMLNPYVPWLNGQDPEEDAEVIGALHEFLNSGKVGIGSDGAYYSFS